MLDIPINGDSIKLGQFIKLASLVATGGEAKAVSYTHLTLPTILLV